MLLRCIAALFFKAAVLCDILPFKILSCAIYISYSCVDSCNEIIAIVDVIVEHCKRLHNSIKQTSYFFCFKFNASLDCQCICILVGSHNTTNIFLLLLRHNPHYNINTLSSNYSVSTQRPSNISYYHVVLLHKLQPLFFATPFFFTLPCFLFFFFA